MEMLEFKWHTATVKAFLDNYMKALNKEFFFRSNKKCKPSFDQHIEAHIVEKMRESNAGYL